MNDIFDALRYYDENQIRELYDSILYINYPLYNWLKDDKIICIYQNLVLHNDIGKQTFSQLLNGMDQDLDTYEISYVAKYLFYDAMFFYLIQVLFILQDKMNYECSVLLVNFEMSIIHLLSEKKGKDNCFESLLCDLILLILQQKEYSVVEKKIQREFQCVINTVVD